MKSWPGLAVAPAETVWIGDVACFYLFIHSGNAAAKIGITTRHPSTRKPPGCLLEDIALGDFHAVRDAEYVVKKAMGWRESGSFLDLKPLYESAVAQYALFKPVFWQQCIKPDHLLVSDRKLLERISVVQ